MFRRFAGIHPPAAGPPRRGRRRVRRGAGVVGRPRGHGRVVVRRRLATGDGAEPPAPPARHRARHGADRLPRGPRARRRAAARVHHAVPADLPHVLAGPGGRHREGGGRRGLPAAGRAQPRRGGALAVHHAPRDVASAAGRDDGQPRLRPRPPPHRRAGAVDGSVPGPGGDRARRPLPVPAGPGEGVARADERLARPLHRGRVPGHGRPFPRPLRARPAQRLRARHPAHDGLDGTGGSGRRGRHGVPPRRPRGR